MFRAGLVEAAKVLTSEAQKRLLERDQDTGTTYRAIGHRTQGNSVQWGIVQPAPAAPYLEYGFRPHFVPVQYIGGWMRRRGVGIVKVRSQRQRILKPKRQRYRHRTFLAAGVYVGGPNSTLKSSPAGTRGRLGRKMRFWRTKGGSSPYLRPGRVGWPFLRPAIKETPKQLLLQRMAAGIAMAGGIYKSPGIWIQKGVK